MEFIKTRRPIAAIVMTLAFALGGCLNEEESDVDDTPDTPTSGNRAPQIAGSPGEFIMTGDVYEFLPSATDADRDRLTFSIDNLPRWASFDSATGELSGQPLLGDEGTYTGIVITVSDGTATTSLPPFSITVTEASLGSMTLSWSPPTDNSDGTTLTDLAGYRLYYGRSEGRYTHRVVIDNPGVVTYVIDNLFPDTYYVVATAVNNSGFESNYSNVSIKIVEGS